MQCCGDSNYTSNSNNDNNDHDNNNANNNDYYYYSKVRLIQFLKIFCLQLVIILKRTSVCSLSEWLFHFKDFFS